MKKVLGMKKIKQILAGAMLLSSLLMVGSANALPVNLIQNGDFEASNVSLLGWTVSGNANVYTEGTNNWAALGRNVESGDSLISQSFTIDQNNQWDQKLTFDYRFAFVDNSNSQIDVFAAIVGSSEVLHLASYNTNNWIPINGHNEAVLSPQLGFGTYVLEFKLTEANGNTTGSFAKIDNVALTVNVPEPSTMLLLGSGLVGVAVFGRRRRA